MGAAFVEGLPVGKFHGIGPATSAKNELARAYTGLDMRNPSLEFMQANFGKAGAHYYWISKRGDNLRFTRIGSGGRSAPRTHSLAISPNSTI
jgi:DNA polymerase-4